MNKLVRGTQRKMVVVKTADSEIFDEAYFILRKDTPKSNAPEWTMLEEANRIINNSVISREKEARSKRAVSVKEFLFYVGGLVSGSGIIGLCWAIFAS